MHIADVKTDRGIVIEFQHSFLHPDEREARENFYPRMVWVVDGRSRKRDTAQFFASLQAAIVINHEPPIVSVPSNEGALLRDWGASRVPVYFDFGDLSKPSDTLWRLNPCIANGRAYLSPVLKTGFLHVHLKGEPFEETCTEAVERVADRYERVAARYLMQQAQAPQSQPPTGFQRYLYWRERRRRRF
jgi:hypothetical protein